MGQVGTQRGQPMKTMEPGQPGQTFSTGEPMLSISATNSKRGAEPSSRQCWDACAADIPASAGTYFTSIQTRPRSGSDSGNDDVFQLSLVDDQGCSSASRNQWEGGAACESCLKPPSPQV